MDKREAIKQRLKERTTSKRFKLSEGETTFRVLPNVKGLDKFAFVEYAMHSNVGARKAYLRCGDKKAGEGNCWLCKKLAELGKSAKSSVREAADKMKRKEAFAVQIAYLSDGKWIGPTIWEMPTSVANKLLGIMGRRDVENPTKGYNLTITRQGTGMTDTRYGDIERDEEPSEAPEKILSALQPFGEVVRKYDEALQKKEYFGHEQAEEEEEPAAVEEEEETQKPKPTGKKARVAEPEPEEEEETEEKEPEPEEEESAEDELFGDDVPDLDAEEQAQEEEEQSEEQEEEKPKAKATVKAKVKVPEKAAAKPAPKSKPKPVTVPDDDF